MANDEIPLRRYTITELAALYRVSVRTMRRYLKGVPDLGRRLGHFYSLIQVGKIWNFLGRPFVVLFAYLGSLGDSFGRTTDLQPDNSTTPNRSADFREPDTTSTITAMELNPTSIVGLITFVTLCDIALKRKAYFEPGYISTHGQAAQLRLVVLILQITSISVGVFFLGYVVGKYIFA